MNEWGRLEIRPKQGVNRRVTLATKPERVLCELTLSPHVVTMAEGSSTGGDPHRTLTEMRCAAWDLAVGPRIQWLDISSMSSLSPHGVTAGAPRFTATLAV